MIAETYVPTNSITLHVVEAGPETGPLVILLHGFPEFWYGWRHQIGPLAEAGYRVWAPDQRGYNTSEKPKGIAAYNLDALAADIVGLIDAAGREKAFVVGHDWGAVVAWRMANRYPERLERVVILNVPHPAVMQRYVLTHPRQMVRSLYVLFFQIPRLPEALARRDNWRGVVEALRQSSRPGAFADDDFDRYREAWSQPGAFTAMLNWYRAFVRGPRKTLESSRITVPTLMLWGVHDVALERGLAERSIAMCEKGRLIFFEEATHWLQHEEPARVNELIVEFMTS